VARAWPAVGGGRRCEGTGGARMAGSHGDARTVGIGGARADGGVYVALVSSTAP
jgi:hypothetical protein